MPVAIIDIQPESDNAELDSSDDELTGKEEYIVYHIMPAINR